MNTEGCPEGYFTDEILNMGNMGAKSCDGSVGAWLGIAINFVLLRWILLIPQISHTKRQWKAKNDSRLARSQASRRMIRARIPFFLLSQCMTAFFQSLLVILTSLNVANISNGASIFLFGLTILAIASGQLLMARSIIVLGKKIIPLSEKRMDGQGKLQDLGKLNTVLKVLGVIGMACAVLCGLFFAIALGLVDKRWPFQVGFICMAGYQGLVAISILYQYERCLQAISEISKTNSSSEGGNPVSGGQISSGTSPVNLRNRPSTGLQQAVRIMRTQQLIVAITAFSMMAISLLLAFFVLPLTYYAYIIIFVGADCLFQASLLAASRRGRRKRVNNEVGLVLNSDSRKANNPKVAFSGETDDKHISLPGNSTTFNS